MSLDKDVDQKLDGIKCRISQLEQNLEWPNKSDQNSILINQKEKNKVVFGLKESLKKTCVDRNNDDMNELVRMFDW